RFRPTEVQVGTQSDGRYEVLGGVAPGDLVATSGVFLIAAEARIRTTAKYWDGTTEPDAAAPPPASAPPAMPPAAPKAAPRLASAPPSATPAQDFTCPMHPEVHSPTPGKCPKCGMDLVPAPRRP